MSSAIITATSDKSSFSTSCITSTERNQINSQKVSILFMGDNNTHKMMDSNNTRLTVAIDSDTEEEENIHTDYP